MNTPTTDESDLALAELAPLTDRLYEALEGATAISRSYFEDTIGAPVDRPLFPNLVRYHVKRLLGAKGHEVRDELEYEQQSLPNNGLALRCARYGIRILKAHDGDLPPPGPSKSKQAFYAQQLELPLVPEEYAHAEPIRLNLIILWDVEWNFSLSRLTLVCPRSGDVTHASVQTYWSVPIPHPGDRASVITPENEFAEELDDLDISVPENADAEVGPAQ
jgi:hypothetical protein